MYCILVVPLVVLWSNVCKNVRDLGRNCVMVSLVSPFDSENRTLQPLPFHLPIKHGSYLLPAEFPNVFVLQQYFLLFVESCFTLNKLSPTTGVSLSLIN